MDDEIARLRAELHKARTDLLDCLPPPYDRLIYGFMRCDDYERWEAGFFRLLCENALLGLGRFERLEEADDARAPCPLCGRRNSAGHGFRIPEGLFRHFEGFGRTRRCAITGALRELAFELFMKREAAASQIGDLERRTGIEPVACRIGAGRSVH